MKKMDHFFFCFVFFIDMARKKEMHHTSFNPHET